MLIQAPSVLMLGGSASADPPRRCKPSLSMPSPPEPTVRVLDDGLIEVHCVLPCCSSAGDIDVDLKNGTRIEIEVKDEYR